MSADNPVEPTDPAPDASEPAADTSRPALETSENEVTQQDASGALADHQEDSNGLSSKSLSALADDATDIRSAPSESGWAGGVNSEARTVIRGGSSRSAAPPALPTTDRSPAAVAKVLLGQQLNHFRLESLIGGGGMGAVFRAHDQQLDRVVAIKVIPFVGEDPDLNRRFRNEAQSAAKLDHPNIARVFDVGSHENWHYIVFEFIEGTNIRDRVLRDGPLTIDDAVFATCQLADAIGHAWQRGIVHRDIKPSNVVINLDEQIKLVDMGLARSQNVELSEDLTASGVTLGTFDYISPEQALDPRDADVRSDIYSLGCTLYFMVTGQPPYPGGTMLQKLMSHGNAPPPDPRDLRADLSEDLAMIVQRLLAKSPRDRYQTVDDLMLDLRELASREGLTRTLAVSGSVSSSEGFSFRGWDKVLPWAIAALLLVGIATWMKVSSVISDGYPVVPSPGDAKPVLDRLAMVSPEDAGTSSASEPSELRGENDSLNGQSTADGFNPGSSEVEGDGPSETLTEVPSGDVLTGPPLGSGESVAMPAGSIPDESPGLASSLLGTSPSAALNNRTSGNTTSDIASVPTEAGSSSPSVPSNLNGQNNAAIGPMVGVETGIAMPIPFAASPPIAVRVVDQSSLPAGLVDVSQLIPYRDHSFGGTAMVRSIADAIDICETYALTRVELAARELETGPLSIMSDDLQIVAVGGRTTLRVNSADLLSMERSQMIRVWANRMEWQGIDFVWDVPISELDGGSLFSLSENRMFRLSDCTVTVRNPARRNEVYAFEIVTDPEKVGPTVTGPASVPNALTTRGDGRELYEDSLSSVASDLPLVAMELANVIVRGEMTMVHLDFAAELQLKWTNGLLAISERMIDTAGALEEIGISAPSMRVELTQVTASIPQGLFRMRLGVSGRYPVALDRQANRCVFLVQPGVPHFEITGLRETRPVRSLLQIRGASNAYPSRTDLQDPFLVMNGSDGGEEIVLLEALVSDDPEWSREESPRWSVRWTFFPLSDSEPSQLIPADFRQDGSISVGCDEQTLPPLSKSRVPGADEIFVN